jgi:multicomponent Na+:H+ antiporter subunit E
MAGNTPQRRRRTLVSHAISVFATCYLVWTLLTWTLTLEVLTVGAAVSALITAAMLPLLADSGTIRVTPRRVARVGALAALVARNIVLANLQLARRIWSPSRPIRTGMVVVPTKVRSDSGLCAVGVITSLIVDNQIVDVDRARHTMLYHAIVVPEPDAAYDQVNGPIDRRVAALEQLVEDRDD